jgi:hypothetical protein
MSRTRDTADLVTLNALNAEGGRVGIGTTAKSNQLTVEGNTNITGITTVSQLHSSGAVKGTSVALNDASKFIVNTSGNLSAQAVTANNGLNIFGDSLLVEGGTTFFGSSGTPLDTRQYGNYEFRDSDNDINIKLHQTGDLDVGRNLSVTGVVTASSYVGDGSGLTGIAGTANVSTNTLVVSGVTTSTGGITVDRTSIPNNVLTGKLGGVTKSQIIANGNAQFTGLTATGTLGVTGVTTFSNNVNITGDLIVSGTTQKSSLSVVNAEVTGIATIATNEVTNSTVTNLNVAGVTTSTGGLVVNRTSAPNNVLTVQLGGVTKAQIIANGNAQFQNTTVNNLVAGVTTATGLDVNGNAEISGNLKIDGVLTYDDVTNIDSVGVITARKGVNITSGGLAVVGVTTVATMNVGGDITLSTAQDIGIIDNSGLALRIMESGSTEYLRIVTTDGNEKIETKKTLETDGLLSVGGGVTMANTTDIQMADNSGFAFRIREGNNEYMRFTTTDGGEKIVTKKALEVDGALDIDGAVDCSGQVTFTGAQTITIPDNLGFGLRVSSADSAEFVRFTTTDGSELVDFSKNVKLDGGLTLNSNIAAQAGSVDITMISGNSNAIDFVIDGGNRMMRFNTNQQKVHLEQNFEVDGDSTLAAVSVTSLDSTGNIGINTTIPTITSGSGMEIVGSTAGMRLRLTGAGNWAFVEFADETDTVKFMTGYRTSSGLYGIRPGASLNSTTGVAVDSVGNVGINITPTSRLHVNGNALIVGITTVNSLVSSGNAKIGGTPPWTVSGGNFRNLSISGQNSSSSGFLWLGNGAAATNANFDLGRINFNNGPELVAQISGATATTATDDGSLHFYTRETGGSLTDRMTIGTSGNVGVNCTAVRNFQIHSGTSSSNLVITNSTTGATDNNGFLIQQDGNNSYVWNKENSFLSLGANSTEFIRLGAGGTVIISSTGTFTPYVTGTNFQITDDTLAKLVLNNPGNATYSFSVGTDNDLVIRDESQTVNRIVLDYLTGTTTFGGYVTALGYNAEPTNSGFSGFTIKNPDDSSIDVDIKANGDAVFKGNFKVGSTTDYIQSDTTNGVFIVQSSTTKANLAMDGSATFAGSVTIDSVAISAIQTSAEAFADNDTSLMTSAAIDDKFNAIGGITQTTGTSTGTFRGATGEPGSLQTTTISYVKTGKQVVATFNTGAVSWVGYTGGFSMTGLPFAAASGIDFTCAFMSSGSVFEASNNDGLCGFIAGGGTTLEAKAQDGNNATVTWSPSGTDIIEATMVYFTD